MGLVPSGAGLDGLQGMLVYAPSDVLLEVLGEQFKGVLCCDYFRAYRKYRRLNDNVVVQFCLAHFIRDVQFLTDQPNPANREHGERLLGQFRKLFQTIHRRDRYASASTFRRFGRPDSGSATSWRTRPSCAARGSNEAAHLPDRSGARFTGYLGVISAPDIAARPGRLFRRPTIWPSKPFGWWRFLGG